MSARVRHGGRGGGYATCRYLGRGACSNRIPAVAQSRCKEKIPSKARLAPLTLDLLLLLLGERLNGEGL
jgi:hypothetical protein